MARIAGVNIPSNKRLVIALTYIYGIGKKTSIDLCKAAQLSESMRVNNLTEAEIATLRELIEQQYVVESDRRRMVASYITDLIEMGSYRGIRHRKRLPVRGQRTHTNARTRKGKAAPIANKKKVGK